MDIYVIHNTGNFIIVHNAQKQNYKTVTSTHKMWKSQIYNIKITKVTDTMH